MLLVLILKVQKKEHNFDTSRIALSMTAQDAGKSVAAPAENEKPALNPRATVIIVKIP